MFIFNKLIPIDDMILMNENCFYLQNYNTCPSPTFEFLNINELVFIMSLKNVIKRLFKLLHLLGISPAIFCERQQKLVVNGKSEKYMLRITVFVLVVMEIFFVLLCVLSFSDVLNVFDSSNTGNILILIQLLESAGIQLVLSTVFYVFRFRNMNIFKQIFEFAERINNEEVNKRIIRRFYIQYQLNIILIILFIGNMIMVGRTSNYKWIMYICSVVVLGIYFTYSSIYLTCFSCLIFVAVESLIFLNNSIQMAKTTQELMKWLTLRNQLLAMCRQDLQLVYSFVFVLQSAFTLTSISALFFITTVEFEWLHQKFFTSLQVLTQVFLYSLPPLIIFVKAICANDIDKEAQKTAQILARIPRTKTSLDQMIDKFLWKNLRPKPILTAYGFFSLDRSTLFKLFTAVFTYMVILVQFKDMENSTKILKKQT
ncbi:isoform D, Gustatory and pheromone receptor 39a [Lucilia cuprina]|nr:isoform D, Gustatory and pheromone receptor 39a [Lucilia cuprina]